MTPPAAPPTAEEFHHVRQAQRRAAPWPYADLDVDRLRAGGWRPTPVRELILKVSQICNIACDYCYVYTAADGSWARRPAEMAPETWRAALDNLGRHVAAHGQRHVRVILHGGEPLLIGAARVEEIAHYARRAVPAGCAVTVGLQTNGTLLTEATVARLRAAGVAVGVSVDGTEADHDRHRRTRSGRGTFATARAGLDLLRRPENRSIYAGVLCVVAPDTDPLACYRQLLAFAPPAIDLLLPHANHDQPPPAGATPYGDWLVAVFDQWYAEADAPPVRLFDDVLALLLGGRSRSEQVGLSPAAMLVVESDGSVEQVDALKSAYEGAAATGRDVRRDEFDAVLDDPGVVARQIGRAALCDTCLACPVHLVCGGGHYAHRYRHGEGFRNPSAYCADMLRFIGHVAGRVRADVRRPSREAG